MKKINLGKESLEFWDNLDAKQYRQVGRKITSLSRNSSPQDAKELVGYSGVFRVDCGEYRIIYCINEDTIEVELIGKRNDGEIYKKFERRIKYKYREH